MGKRNKPKLALLWLSAVRLWCPSAILCLTTTNGFLKSGRKDSNGMLKSQRMDLIWKGFLKLYPLAKSTFYSHSQPGKTTMRNPNIEIKFLFYSPFESNKILCVLKNYNLDRSPTLLFHYQQESNFCWNSRIIFVSNKNTRENSAWIESRKKCVGTSKV